MRTNAVDIKIKVDVLIMDGEKILLIKERGQKQDKYRWNIIKGTYGDIPREDIFETAIRECKEEVSVDIKVLYALGVYIPRNNNKIRIHFGFVGRIIQGVPVLAGKKEQKYRNEDIIEAKWFSKQELKMMKKNEFLNKESFFIIQDWINGVQYPLSIFRKFNFQLI